MALPMDRLRKTRGVVRTGITRALALLNELLQQPSPEVATLSSHVNYIVRPEPELTALNEKIADATDDHGLEQELEGAAEYTRKVSYAVSRAGFLLLNAQQVPIATDSVATGGAAAPTIDPMGASGGHTYSSRHRTVTVPELQIPVFAGNLHDWQGFWDHFNVTIHENTELPKMEKFKCLLTYLIGDTKRAIEGIRLADTIYDIAVKTLVQRLGRQGLLINEHIDQLMASRPIRSSMDIERV